MKKLPKNKGFIKPSCDFGLSSLRIAVTGAGLIAMILACVPARADDDPFQLDTSHWMSFDHYKDADKRGTLDKISPPAKIDTPTADSQATPAPDQTAADAAAAPAAVAAPTRPIDLPIMPGMNKGFSLQVNSTEDGRKEPSPVLAKSGEEPDLHLSDKNWQSPTSVQQARNGDASNEDEDAPLNVRMSYLPDSKITPEASPEQESAQKLAHIALEKSIANKYRQPDKTPAEVAACAALDAYKKQQLEAIQSDRQTLVALQEAIRSMGLDKKLDFMTSSNSALNISGKQDFPNADATAKTTVR